MDHAHARDIATRAEKVRPSLDGSGALRLTTLVGILIALTVFTISAALRPWFLDRGVSTQSLEMYPGMFVVLAAVVVFTVFNRRNRRRLHEARETMLCPHCRAVLREDGPAHWQACDDTARVCQSCKETITDELYAAAALPTLPGELWRRAGRRPAWIIVSMILPALYFGFWIAFRPASDWLERRGHESPDALLFLLVLPITAVVMSIALLTTLRFKRSVNLAAARWLDAPFCPACDTPFPEGSLDSPILRCESCDTRMSTAVGTFESLAARAVVGPSTPVPWPRGQSTQPRPPAQSGDSHSR